MLAEVDLEICYRQCQESPNTTEVLLQPEGRVMVYMPHDDQGKNQKLALSAFELLGYQIC